MSMTYHSYPNVCSGFIIYGFYAKTKEEQLDSIYKLLQNTDTSGNGRNWHIDGHCSAVTNNKQLPGREALDEIGFLRNADNEQYKSKRHDTLCCMHSISVEKLKGWFQSYKANFDKRFAIQVKAQKNYKKFITNSKKALKEMLTNA